MQKGNLLVRTLSRALVVLLIAGLIADPVTAAGVRAAAADRIDENLRISANCSSIFETEALAPDFVSRQAPGDRISARVESQIARPVYYRNPSPPGHLALYRRGFSRKWAFTRRHSHKGIGEELLTSTRGLYGEYGRTFTFSGPGLFGHPPEDLLDALYEEHVDYWKSLPWAWRSQIALLPRDAMKVTLVFRGMKLEDLDEATLQTFRTELAKLERSAKPLRMVLGPENWFRDRASHGKMVPTAGSFITELHFTDEKDLKAAHALHDQVSKILQSREFPEQFQFHISWATVTGELFDWDVKELTKRFAQHRKATRKRLREKPYLLNRLSLQVMKGMRDRREVARYVLGKPSADDIQWKNAVPPGGVEISLSVNRPLMPAERHLIDDWLARMKKDFTRGPYQLTSVLHFAEKVLGYKQIEDMNYGYYKDALPLVHIPPDVWNLAKTYARTHKEHIDEASRWYPSELQFLYADIDGIDGPGLYYNLGEMGRVYLKRRISFSYLSFFQVALDKAFYDAGLAKDPHNRWALKMHHHPGSLIGALEFADWLGADELAIFIKNMLSNMKDIQPGGQHHLYALGPAREELDTFVRFLQGLIDRAKELVIQKDGQLKTPRWELHYDAFGEFAGEKALNSLFALEKQSA